MSEMKEVKRYRIRFNELDGWGVSCASVANSDVVLASDYDALLSEKAALAAENERLREELTQRIGKAVPMTEWEKLVADRDRLRTTIAGAREVLRDAADTYEIERGKAGSEWHRKLLTKWIDQLRALSSIGDLPAGEEG